jgi:hypothetical protein
MRLLAELKPLILVTVTVAVAGALVTLQSHAEIAALPTSICEVQAHPEKFVGKRISVQASVLSDGVERTLLVEDREHACQGGIVPISDPKRPQSQAAGDQLSKAIFTGRPGTIDKKITALFTGVISMGDPDAFMLAPGRKIPLLTIESVENIHVLPAN